LNKRGRGHHLRETLIPIPQAYANLNALLVSPHIAREEGEGNTRKWKRKECNGYRRYGKNP